MKKIALLFLSFIMGVSFSNMEAQTSPIGDWYGTLDLGNMKLRIVFHIQETEGGFEGTMDSPDQNVEGIPIEEVKFEAPELAISAPALGMTYMGTYDAEQKTLSGTFQQGPLEVPLNLVQDKPDGPNRPQTPQPPYPYEVEELSVMNMEADVQLSGTLTKPKGKGPFPAAVLISGSGPQDRDETIFDHKPFAVMADDLTKAGFAVFRYDDRGYGQSTGDFATATSEDFALDAKAIIQELRKRPDLDPDHIGIIGHSEGGLIGSILASKDEKLAFMVFLAGPGVNGEDLLVMQEYDLLKMQGFPEETLLKWRPIRKKAFELIRNTPNEAQAYILLSSNAEDWLSPLNDMEKQILRVNENTFADQFQPYFTPWMMYFIKADPVDFLQKTESPILALFGGKDLQVPATENQAAMEKGLADKSNITYHTFPEKNHFFQNATTGLPAEYGQIEETISPDVLEYMRNWMLEIVE